MDPNRLFVNNAKRVIVKVGTAVVTRPEDGKFALGRLGSLCEQVKQLLDAGVEVILVTSGAVGMGCQRLRHRRVLTSTVAELGKREAQLDGKACAAVGQSGLIFLYDTLFSQLDVASSQLLVSNKDFQNDDFKNQLVDTVNSLLDMQVVPIFNENDAVSTREQPYKEFGGGFWDNDSLAALLALELKVDLLVLLMDVDGLYTKPPLEPGSKLIHTYVKEKHDHLVTFGERTNKGRGGMDAKVHAAQYAASAGVPVIIASGFVPYSLQKIMWGNRIGTLFHKDAFRLAYDDFETSARERATRARDASSFLQTLPFDERQSILRDIARRLEENEESILAENELDVRDAKKHGLSDALIDTFTLRPQKIKELSQTIGRLAKMKDPINLIQKRTEISERLTWDKFSSSLGVFLIVFETNIETIILNSTMAIRNGNSLLLKGPKEASRSQSIFHKIVTEALPRDIQKDLVQMIASKDELRELIKLDDLVNLMIVRGAIHTLAELKQESKIPTIVHGGEFSMCLI